MNQVQRIRAGGSQITRPLKVLIPLIKDELQEGDAAGHDHYRRAGEMLIEAKDQVAHGAWTQWLTKNFELSQRQAQVYMQWARHKAQMRSGDAHLESFSSLNDMTGATERQREQRNATQEKAFRKTLRDVAREDFVQDRQAKDEEIKLHRELAAELVDLGYRALATRLHPDRGGTKVAMMRLNRVRDELKEVAQTRRFLS
jgi:hypothetical protein